MFNDEEYLTELLMFTKSDSILIINSKGRLQRLYCPFHVIVIRKVPNLNVGDIDKVDAVKITLKLEEVYIIGQSAYFVWNFKIYIT